MFPKKMAEPPKLKEHPPSIDSSDGEDDIDNLIPTRSKAKERSASGQLSQHSRFGSKGALHSPGGSMHSFDLQVNGFLCLSPSDIEYICILRGKRCSQLFNRVLNDWIYLIFELRLFAIKRIEKRLGSRQMIKLYDIMTHIIFISTQCLSLPFNLFDYCFTSDNKKNVPLSLSMIGLSTLYDILFYFCMFSFLLSLF